MSERRQAGTTLLFETGRLRAVRFDFEPGAQTGWHVHGAAYVITTVTPCRMKVEAPDGSRTEASFGAGESYHRPKGVEHNVINAGSRPMSFVELELLDEGRASCGS